jgi:hypothetical protein
MYTDPHVKYRLFFSDVSKTLIFSPDFLKNTEKPNFRKIRQVGAEFFHTDDHIEGQA